MNFTTFNLIEGVFWIALGTICATILFTAETRYKKLASASAAVFILFGLSDFVEIAVQDSFLDSLSWLLLWKIAGVVGIIAVIIGYIKLRITH
ncbi:MAG: hypothetical protein UX07_C0025G0007 [Parcubacteria group bacterium GW2011_GWA2_45_30]|nr:MAG: hypothetical protein UX07_C0025G0007 [Parcubacteria group bacterium GW2011_GWA2_45_30]